MSLTMNEILNSVQVVRDLRDSIQEDGTEAWRAAVIAAERLGWVKVDRWFDDSVMYRRGDVSISIIVHDGQILCNSSSFYPQS